MGKGSRENADYFVEDGKDLGRRNYARQKAKLSRGTAAASGSKEPSRHPDAQRRATDIHIPGPIGGGTETLRLAKQKRRAKAKKKVRQEEAERVLATSGPAVSADRALPPATRGTMLSDLLRDVQENASIVGRAARDLYGSLGSLARTPVRLFRVIWSGQRANA